MRRIVFITGCCLPLLLAQLLLCNAADQRTQLSINSGWKFIRQDIADASSITTSDSAWETVNIPHTWNSEDITDEAVGYYRGIGWYRKSIFIPKDYKGKHIVLYFEAACIKAEAYVNGKSVGRHLGGFTAFSFAVDNVLEYGKENLIAVKVDNAKELSAIVPPVSGDFSLMGGIYRDIFLIAESKIHFHDNIAGSGVLVRTPSVSREKATVEIEASIANETAQQRKGRAVFTIRDRARKSVAELVQNIVLKPNSTTTVKINGVVQSPLLWSPENPNLYTTTSRIVDEQENVLDELTFHTGFRWFSLDSKRGFFLNGQSYKLRGSARHQDYKGVGNALPNAQHERDMRILKEMGANFVRISHYPQDPAIYAACDKLGLIAWSEIPVVDKVMPGPEFTENCLTMMKEMVVQNFNHPCVVIWGYHNEIWDIDSAAVSNARALEKLTRRLDPHRLTGMAFHTAIDWKYFKDSVSLSMFNIAMINGFNVYQGWYGGGLDNLAAFFDRLHNFNPNTPVMLSEFGAGSSVNIHTFEPTLFDFSEEYQVKFHDTYLREGAKRDWIIGFSIWNLIDFQRDGREDVSPHINNKGMVTTDRIPKDIYFYYKARWSKEPFVYIAGHHWKKRLAVVNDLQGDTLLPVTVYSNMPEAELVHNTRSLGTKPIVDGMATWNVPFREGANTLESSGTRTGELQKDLLTVNYRFVPRHLTRENFPDGGLNVNVGQSRTFYTDPITEEIWLPDQRYAKRSWGYLDGEVYRKWPSNAAWNGLREGIHKVVLGTQNQPVFQTFMEGISAYRFDVPDGNFIVTLYFTEPLDDEQRNHQERIFSVSINQQNVVRSLNLSKQFGLCRAVMFDVHVTAKDGSGISINMEPVKGKTVLSGISVKRE